MFFAYHAEQKALVVSTPKGPVGYLTRYLRAVGWRCDDAALHGALPRADESGLLTGASQVDIQRAATAETERRKLQSAIRR